MSTLQIGVRHRYLEHYPSNGRRIWYLALAVIATIMLYYESYVLPSVAPLVLRSFSLPVSTYIGILLVSNVIGALSAIFGSLSDRIGRSNLIVYGLLVTALGTVGISFANSLGVFFVLIVVLGFIEGIILVATPALVRDFSPRFGRALAMGFWTVGPVGGSVLATVIASQTLPTYGTWQSQYVIAGVVGVVIFLLCFLFLRELSPGLRDQVMNSLQEKELIESRAATIDVKKAIEHPWRQMLHPRLIGCLATIVVTFLFISRIGVPTSAALMTVFLSLFGITLAVGYVTWLAAYTETVEDINPALVATGLAVQGFILRAVVVLSTLAFSFVVRNQFDGSQWATWWWVCIAGLVVFLPTIFVASGYWSPARTRAAVLQKQNAAVEAV